MVEKAALSSQTSSETLKNKQTVGTNCVGTLENKVSQRPVNTESRKTQLKNSRKSLWHWLVTLAIPFPSAGEVFDMQACIPSMWPWYLDLVLEGAKQT